MSRLVRIQFEGTYVVWHAAIPAARPFAQVCPEEIFPNFPIVTLITSLLVGAIYTIGG